MGALDQAHADRCCDVSFKIGDCNVACLTIYAPTTGKAAEQADYLTAVGGLLEGQSDMHFLLGGDWNCVENPVRDTSKPNGRDDGVEMRQLATTHSLTDVYRRLHPSASTMFTNGMATDCAQRRLDRIYVSPGLVGSSCQHEKRKKVVSSTRNPIVAKFAMPGTIEIGPSKFKLGLHLIVGLEDYYAATFERTYAGFLASTPDDVVAAWAGTKTAVRAQLQVIAQRVTRFRRETSPEGQHNLAFESAAMRARLPPSIIAHGSVKLRVRQVRAADLVTSL